MSGRVSRKRNIPARLREEMWYLVCYEDDNNLRVLGSDEICHIFPADDADDDNDDFQIDDIVSAIWLPNGKFYDAKILQKGADRNELMRERMRLEKAQKNNTKEVENSKDSRTQQKRKNPEGASDGQNKKKKQTEGNKENEQKAKDNTDGQKKKKKQTEGNKEKEQKTKEREEKRKKKEEDQERQKLILEARKAQAASRLATSSNSQTEPEVIIFTPEPVLRANTTLSIRSSAQVTPPAQLILHDPDSSQQTNDEHNPQVNINQTSRGLSYCSSKQLTTLAPPTLPSTDSHQNASIRLNAPQSTDRTPLRPSKSMTPSEPRRGLHFQSAVGESSDDEDYDDEIREEDEENLEGSVSISDGSNCSQDHKLEIEALRKRLAKVHKRLNIALKARTSGEVLKNRPGAGVLDKTLATEYKMVEVMEGSGVYWYPHQRAYCSAFKTWAGYINAATDIFFTKETLAISCTKGNAKKGKNGHHPLDPLVIEALIGKVCSKFAKDSPVPSQVVQKINMKCVEARRPQRIRVNPSN